ncbi:hypothetical protein M513_09277 [Trichuris suis]|uniref:Uncharacterized protein n=1 Tax=Trichuris suis TaxID=68888 RepID=A0A085LXW4_9BILA|nr:hypothetical protein M513_09277 [Trichuris suis]
MVARQLLTGSFTLTLPSTRLCSTFSSVSSSLNYPSSDILNCQQNELTTNGLQGKQKEEKRQIMMKIRKLLRDN